MLEKRKREKVTAEITLSHLMHLTVELGSPMNREQALAFLNEGGHAYEMWRQMILAGEDIIKNSIRRRDLTSQVL